MAFQDGAKRAGVAPARAGHEGRGRRPRGIHGRRHRRPQLAPRQDPRHEPARQDAQVITPRCRSRRCSATRPTCAAKTQGRATYTMQFSHYEPVPAAIQEEIVAKVADASTSYTRTRGEIDGQGKVRPHQAPRERRHDRSHRPRQDDADGGDREGAVAQGDGEGDHVRGHRQGRDGPRRDQDGDDRGERTWSTRRRSATTRTSIAPATPTTSRT